MGRRTINQDLVERFVQYRVLAPRMNSGKRSKPSRYGIEVFFEKFPELHEIDHKLGSWELLLIKKPGEDLINRDTISRAFVAVRSKLQVLITIDESIAEFFRDHDEELSEWLCGQRGFFIRELQWRAKKYFFDCRDEKRNDRATLYGAKNPGVYWSLLSLHVCTTFLQSPKEGDALAECDYSLDGDCPRLANAAGICSEASLYVIQRLIEQNRKTLRQNTRNDDLPLGVILSLDKASHLIPEVLDSFKEQVGPQAELSMRAKREMMDEAAEKMKSHNERWHAIYKMRINKDMKMSFPEIAEEFRVTRNESITSGAARSLFDRASDWLKEEIGLRLEKPNDP